MGDYGLVRPAVRGSVPTPLPFRVASVALFGDSRRPGMKEGCSGENVLERER